MLYSQLPLPKLVTKQEPNLKKTPVIPLKIPSEKVNSMTTTANYEKKIAAKFIGNDKNLPPSPRKIKSAWTNPNLSFFSQKSDNPKFSNDVKLQSKLMNSTNISNSSSSLSESSPAIAKSLLESQGAISSAVTPTIVAAESKLGSAITHEALENINSILENISIKRESKKEPLTTSNKNKTFQEPGMTVKELKLNVNTSLSLKEKKRGGLEIAAINPNEIYEEENYQQQQNYSIKNHECEEYAEGDEGQMQEGYEGEECQDVENEGYVENSQDDIGWLSSAVGADSRSYDGSSSCSVISFQIYCNRTFGK